MDVSISFHDRDQGCNVMNPKVLSTKRTQILSGRKVAAVLAVLAALISAGCRKHSPPMDLKPPDPRPVYAIQVTDADEAAILQQQLRIDPLRMAGGTFYFHAAEAQLGLVRDAGYFAQQQNPAATYRRVVEVRKAAKPTEDQVLKFGVQLLNREPDHLVVSGTLDQLAALQSAGFRLQAPAREPRPRFVRIAVTDNRASVQRLSEMGVDIHSVEADREQGAREGSFRRWTVFGGAFDSVIDAVKQGGFTVTPYTPATNTPSAKK